MMMMMVMMTATMETQRGSDGEAAMGNTDERFFLLFQYLWRRRTPKPDHIVEIFIEKWYTFAT